MFEIIGLAATGVATVWGYVQSRRYVRNRLRFVDAAQKPLVPVVAGAAAAVVAAPVVWLLPLVGAGTALVFGIGVGVGVRHGQSDSRRLPGY
jgi:inosine-uridine nucleoside N-ribohydrolase